MSEAKSEYVTEALEMLGKGYQPTIEIEEARTVTERRGGKLIDAERSAFVKIFTSFKKELKEMDGDDLKVWIYLALSINRYTKDASPGLRTISEDTDLAVNTVRSILERLEDRGLLDIEKEDGKTNRYRPADYATVSKFDTVNQGTVSKNEGTVSTSRRDFAQLEELDSNNPGTFQLYERNIGPITPMIAGALQDAEKLYSEKWIEEAIFLAVKHNKRNWAYCEVILKRWKTEGKDDGKKLEQKKQTPPAPSKRDPEKKLVTPEMFHVRD